MTSSLQGLVFGSTSFLGSVREKSFLRPDNSPRGNGCTEMLEILHEHTLLSFLSGHFGVFRFMAPNRNYWGVGGLALGGEKCEKCFFFQYFKFFEWNMLNLCLNEWEKPFFLQKWVIKLTFLALKEIKKSNHTASKP